MEKKPASLGIRQGPQVEIIYICDTCEESKALHQPYPGEPQNTDFRQFCWKCRQIKHHRRILPAKPKES